MASYGPTINVYKIGGIKPWWKARETCICCCLRVQSLTDTTAVLSHWIDTTKCCSEMPKYPTHLVEVSRVVQIGGTLFLLR